MKLLLIHQIFLSAGQGGGTRHFELSRYAVNRGQEVTVIASDVSYLDGKRVGGDGTPELVEGVEVRRARTLQTLHRSFVWRVLAFLSFTVTSVFKGLGVKGVDVVMGTSPPLPQAFSAWVVAFLRRKPFLLEIRDLWPDFAVDMGVMTNPVLIWLARRLEVFLYNRATHILVNSPAYYDYLIDTRGVRHDKISVIPNGVDPTMFDPQETGAVVREEFGLRDKFVVTYAGAIGPANDISTIIRAADQLKDQTDIHFLLVGDGKDRLNVEALKDQLGLTNVTFAGLRSKNEMRVILGASDVCLATLMSIAMFKTVYPNKIFDYLAAGRPIILGIDGVIRDVVEKAEAGVFVEPGSEQAIVEAVQQMHANPHEARAMGLRGCEYVAEHFNRMDQAEAFVRLVTGLAKAR